jgi:hypothetical protein
MAIMTNSKRKYRRYGTIVVLAVAGGALGLSQLVQAGPPQTPPGTYYDAVAGSPALPCHDSTGRPVDGPEFSLGASFERHQKSHEERRCDEPGPVGRANYHSVIYGDCQATADHGCAPPVEIQTYPACERNPSSYRLTPEGDAVPHQDARVAGFPAAWFEDGRRLEVYLKDATIVIFGENRGQLTRAAAQLHREQSNPNTAQVSCPAPAA